MPTADLGNIVATDTIISRQDSCELLQKGTCNENKQEVTFLHLVYFDSDELFCNSCIVINFSSQFAGLAAYACSHQFIKRLGENKTNMHIMSEISPEHADLKKQMPVLSSTSACMLMLSAASIVRFSIANWYSNRHTARCVGHDTKVHLSSDLS